MEGDRHVAEPPGRGLVPDDPSSESMRTLMEMRANGMVSKEQLLRRLNLDKDR